MFHFTLKTLIKSLSNYLIIHLKGFQDDTVRLCEQLSAAKRVPKGELPEPDESARGATRTSQSERLSSPVSV